MKNNDLGLKAKAVLEAYVPEMDARISEYFDGEIKKSFGFNGRQKEVVKELLEHAKEYIMRPQKRLRSSFVHYAYKLGGGHVSKIVWRVAMAMDLVQAALLIHDDIMDRDDIRRGGLATHKYYEKQYKSDGHFGESMAINVGDIVLCMGFDLLSDCGDIAVLTKMFSGIVQTGFGQAFDMVLEKEKRWTEEDVIALHKAKSAIYTYEIPLFSGACLAGLSEEVLKLLHEYAMDGGVAFQLQDDILGVFGDDTKTRKSGYRDIKEGKVTLLFVNSKNERLKELWGKQNISKVEVQEARNIIRETGSLDYSRKLAKEYARKAAETAERLRQFNLNEEAIDYIQGIAEYMVEREV